MNCHICHSEARIIEDQQFGLNYYYCLQCGFISQDRESIPAFSDARDEYDRHENSIENEGYVNFFKRFIEASILPFVDQGKGLDFGSGPEPVLSQVLKRDYGLMVDIYDLHYQPVKVYEHQQYDYIVSTEVIEHIEDPMAVMKLWHEHLKPGGVLAVMTLFHEEDEAHFLDWWYRRDITHISFFTVRTFNYMAEKIGFEIIFTDNKRYITFKKK